MLKSWLILFLCFLFACKSNGPRDKQLLPDKNDVNEIVKVVIEKEDSVHRNALLVSELHRVMVATPALPDNVPPPPDLLQLNSLLNVKINNEVFFRKTDSLHLLFQNHLYKTFPIEKELAKRIKFISSAEAASDMASEKSIRFYKMTIPIFSSDNKKAYVEWDYSCPLCGYATAIFLKKEDGKWLIVREENLWVS